MIIGELAHLWGRMDGHHFDQQQERGCTTKMEFLVRFAIYLGEIYASTTKKDTSVTFRAERIFFLSYL